jgi:hypothetical protein
MGAALRVARRTRPSFSTVARPARCNTRTCFDTAGSDISKRDASSLIERSPAARRERMSRRVGSASAKKVSSSDWER